MGSAGGCGSVAATAAGGGIRLAFASPTSDSLGPRPLMGVQPGSPQGLVCSAYLPADAGTPASLLLSPPGLEHLVPMPLPRSAEMATAMRVELTRGPAEKPGTVPATWASSAPMVVAISTPAMDASYATPILDTAASLLSALPCDFDTRMTWHTGSPPKDGTVALPARAPTISSVMPEEMRRASPAQRGAAAPDAAEHGRRANGTAAYSPSQTNIVQSPMVNNVQHVPRVTSLQPARCGLCEATVGAEEVEGAAEGTGAGGRFFIEGRYVCDACSQLFGPAKFVPVYHVCINPLCRRKWKQLTPKVLPVFCPPCKRQLEECTSAEQPCLKIAIIEQIFRRWHAVFSELADALGYPAPPPADEAVGCGEQSDGECATRGHWRRVLHAFKECFPQPPRADDVRNWNSVHGRRKHYRGVVHRCHWRFVVNIEAREELGEDLCPMKRVQPGMRAHLVVDWQELLADGTEVRFVVFANPSVEERGTVSRIVRLLNDPRSPPGAAARPSPALRVDVAAPVSTVVIAGGTRPSAIVRTSTAVVPATANVTADSGKAPRKPAHSPPASSDADLATAFSAFDDLVQWSKESPEAEPAEPGGAPRRLVLESALRSRADSGNVSAAGARPVPMPMPTATTAPPLQQPPAWKQRQRQTQQGKHQQQQTLAHRRRCCCRRRASSTQGGTEAWRRCAEYNNVQRSRQVSCMHPEVAVRRLL
eukprot:NODE_1988_length_2316_cov_8.382823.p1 GENE.NODE_1988_length_2316_cov_8.382823~~NODE_1988_length_2316_cov_8.382823.p1  ORF type:complete len:740 (-),score=199.72 NODE_1988_length_2316_cov_8.382823:96-2216(-)